jgi:DNA-binding LytR/AlgR family response regulator
MKPKHVITNKPLAETIVNSIPAPTGAFIKAKKILLEHRHLKQADSHLQLLEIYIKYDDIISIECNNKYEKNTLLMITNDTTIAYVTRSSLHCFEAALPVTFQRISDGFIINVAKITARKLHHKVYVNHTCFAISTLYFDKLVLKMNALLGSSIIP